jgi:hypothetical protein
MEEKRKFGKRATDIYLNENFESKIAEDLDDIKSLSNIINELEIFSKKNKEEKELESKKLLENEVLLKKIIDISPHPILYISREKNQILTNDLFKNLYNLDIDKINYDDFIKNFNHFSISDNLINIEKAIYNTKIVSNKHEVIFFNIFIYPHFFNDIIQGYIIFYYNVNNNISNNILLDSILKNQKVQTIKKNE